MPPPAPPGWEGAADPRAGAGRRRRSWGAVNGSPPASHSGRRHCPGAWPLHKAAWLQPPAACGAGPVFTTFPHPGQAVALPGPPGFRLRPTGRSDFRPKSRLVQILRPACASNQIEAPGHPCGGGSQGSVVLSRGHPIVSRWKVLSQDALVRPIPARFRPARRQLGRLGRRRPGQRHPVRHLALPGQWTRQSDPSPASRSRPGRTARRGRSARRGGAAFTRLLDDLRFRQPWSGGHPCTSGLNCSGGRNPSSSPCGRTGGRWSPGRAALSAPVTPKHPMRGLPAADFTAWAC